jgi:hypothetical protein
MDWRSRWEYVAFVQIIDDPVTAVLPCGTLTIY